jgi:hypothetical protein
MSIECSNTKVNETFVAQGRINVTVTSWSNLEGANISVCGDNLTPLMSGSFHWEELDTIIAALAIAKSQ